MKVLNVGVDKLTVIGNLYDDAESQLQNILDEPHCKILGVPYLSAVRFQLYDGLVYVEYDKTMGKAYNRGNMRIEYNPAKTPPEIIHELVSTFKPMMHDVHFSRVDIAFDCDFDLSKYQHQHKNPSKRSVFYGTDGKVETMYFGSRNSDFYSRTYNKKRQLQEVEQKEIEHEHLWRYEVEIKNRRTIDAMLALDFPLFERVQFTTPDLTGLKALEKLVCTAILDHPEMINELSKDSRTKYKKMIRENISDDVTPLFEAKLKKELPQIKRALEIWERIPSIKEIMNRQWL